jgi:MFS family permease
MVAVSSPTTTISHLLRTSNFRRWWVGFGISQFGDQFYHVALPWVILQLTGSAVAMGTIMMVAASPRIVLLLIGGALSDRISPRRIIIAAAWARAILVTAIACLIWTQTLRVWHLYLLAFAFAVADAFDYPASQAFLPSLVMQEELAAANSVNYATLQFASTVGPAPAGVIVKAFGAAWAFFVDAVSFLFVIFALWKLPDPPCRHHATKKSDLWQSIVEGLKYVHGDQAVRTFALLLGVLNFSIVGPIAVGLADLAKERFSSPTAYGVWVSSFSAGGLIGSLFAGKYKPQKRGLLVLQMCAAVAVELACIGPLRHLWLIAVVLFLMGSGLGFVNVHLRAWYQQRIDPAMLGRVMSLLTLSSFGLMPASMFIAGVLAQWNLRMLFLASALSLLATTGLAALLRAVREI